jgi:hypothetical protein
MNDNIKKTALLTVKLPLDIYLDFMTAVDVLRNRSAAELTQRAALREIDRAKKQTAPEVWEALRVEREQNYKQRSKRKVKERQRALKTGSTPPTASKK